MKQVISASRRTDMPAWYPEVLKDCIRRRYAESANPYSGKKSRIDLDPGRVHTIVLWSKNFAPFLGMQDVFRDYRLYFLFTINDMPGLEPAVPPLEDRLDQLRELALRYGAERIGWRFDPVVFDADGPVSAAASYAEIAAEAAKAGVKRSIFSFLDMYGKVRARNERFGLRIVDPPDDVRLSYARDLARTAARYGLILESCSEKLAPVEGIKKSSCIDGRLLARLAGEPVSLARDTGQRPECNCTASRDIGSYRDMPCPHGCLYCYANPVTNQPAGARP